MTPNGPESGENAMPTNLASGAMSTPASSPIMLSILIGAWRHSHEEDDPRTRVFRKAEYPFPPSRGRLAFQLFADGAADFQPIGRDDRTPHVPCSWLLAGSPTPDLIISDRTHTVFQGRLVLASSERLEIQSRA
jgi:hypothetical protein